MIVRVRVREVEMIPDAVTSAEYDHAGFPVDQRVMALQPVVPQVDVLGAKVSDGKVDVLAVAANHYSEFDELGDITCLVAGSISVVYWNGNNSFLGVKLVFLDVCWVDGTAGAATIEEGLGDEALGSGAGVQLHFDHEIIPAAVLSSNIVDWFAELIQVFSGQLPSFS